MSRASFKFAYETSPLILTGGIAQGMPGGLMPVISLLYPVTLVDPTSPPSNDGPAVHFRPSAGTMLIAAEVAKYGFANQQTAGNAILAKPLTVAMIMEAPAPSTQAGYSAKVTAFSSLKQTLDKHTAAGGTWTVATPAYTFEPGILTTLEDITPDDSGQVQSRWRWIFEFPLISLAAAAAAQNNLHSKLTNQTQVQGDPPSQGGTLNTGGNPQSGVGSQTTPGAGSGQGAQAGQGGSPGQ